MAGDCFGDAVNVAARLLDHAGDNETLITAPVLAGLTARAEADASAASTRWCCAAASSRCRSTCYGGRRSGDSAATQFGDVAPACRARCASACDWLAAEPGLRQPADAGGAGPQPAGALLRRRLARVALACPARLARRQLPAQRPQLQRHLRALRRRRDRQPAPRQLHCCTAAAPSAWAARRPTRRRPACASRCCASATPKRSRWPDRRRPHDAPALRRRRPHQPDAVRERLRRPATACSVSTAASAAEALALARDRRRSCWCIDLHLPDTDGPALLQRPAPRAGLGAVPAFLCSADDGPALRAAGRRRRFRRLLDASRVDAAACGASCRALAAGRLAAAGA